MKQLLVFLIFNFLFFFQSHAQRKSNAENQFYINTGVFGDFDINKDLKEYFGPAFGYQFLSLELIKKRDDKISSFEIGGSYYSKRERFVYPITPYDNSPEWYRVKYDWTKKIKHLNLTYKRGKTLDSENTNAFMYFICYQLGYKGQRYYPLAGQSFPTYFDDVTLSIGAELIYTHINIGPFLLKPSIQYQALHGGILRNEIRNPNLFIEQRVNKSAYFDFGKRIYFRLGLSFANSKKKNKKSRKKR